MGLDHRGRAGSLQLGRTVHAGRLRRVRRGTGRHGDSGRQGEGAALGSRPEIAAGDQSRPGSDRPWTAAEKYKLRGLAKAKLEPKCRVDSCGCSEAWRHVERLTHGFHPTVRQSTGPCWPVACASAGMSCAMTGMVLTESASIRDMTSSCSHELRNSISLTCEPRADSI